jgi:hypothetical protein
MRLGLLTAPFPEASLTEVADWSAANRFESLEIACSALSTGPTRRYAGTTHIDVTSISEPLVPRRPSSTSAVRMPCSEMPVRPAPGPTV